VPPFWLFDQCDYKRKERSAPGGALSYIHSEPVETAAGRLLLTANLCRE